MTLLEQLQTLSQSDTLPMHMPGHKRGTRIAPYLDTLGADLDITEINGFGNLHAPEGVLTDRMALAAQLWGSKKAWWLIGGSTAGLLAAIDAATTAGNKVLLARNCHKAVYNACMLCRLETAYIQPTPFPGQAFADRITPEQVAAALTEHPDTRLAVLTSPTYEGLCSDIASIAEVVHSCGALLLVDEAHGAHLGLHPDFPPSAVTQGADMVVQSLHKTLPSLTQTAMLHLCSDRVSAEELGFRLSVYQTSSPSYLLMASIDSCVQLLTEEKDSLLPQWRSGIRSFYEALTLKHLSLPLADCAYAEPSKLLISTKGTDLTGPQLADLLRSDYRIEPEMSTADTVLCMTGLGDTVEALLRLAAALNEIDHSLTAAPARPLPTPPMPHKLLPIHEAAKDPTELVPLADAVGRISGDFLWAYPPGIPVLVPGEAVHSTLPNYLRRSEELGVDVGSPKGAPQGMIRVLKKG
ncbi:MAG: aminotransferase class V-fold PLP-dependent enzyme [Oscillospiraceae bacterium]|nr:aminotransferase class V-fold PLP-dependent enzyme [Oscillospiraceae bacterium]